MHGMLSDVTYQRLAGTSVLTDFVELPSQLFEHWLSEPEVLKKHVSVSQRRYYTFLSPPPFFIFTLFILYVLCQARHVVTGEPIPDTLLARLMAAKSFNQVKYLLYCTISSALHVGQATRADE
jgi:peptidyl-dipeptidase Dcp